MSTPSNRSDCSSSAESLTLPPLGPIVEEKKTVPFIGDNEKVNQKKLDEWMKSVGNILGSPELRENVTNLHMQLVPAIETLRKAYKHSSEKLKKEMSKLIDQYVLLAVVCEKILDKIGKSADI